jgi:single-strand DNA-binding protein
MSLNNVQLVGRAGNDPDIKYFESGSVNCKINLAVNRNKKDAPPDWFDLSMWGKTAEIAAQYVKKGSLIGVTGSLHLERWLDRTTGATREKPVVNVEQLKLLGSKKDNEEVPS